MNSIEILEIATMTGNMWVHMRDAIEAGTMTDTITESLNSDIEAIHMMTITLAKITESEEAMMTGAGMRSRAALTGLLTPITNYLNINATRKRGMSASTAQESCPGRVLTMSFRIMSAVALNKAHWIDSLRI